jgi:hypothetical protein
MFGMWRTLVQAPRKFYSDLISYTMLAHVRERCGNRLVDLPNSARGTMLGGDGTCTSI